MTADIAVEIRTLEPTTTIAVRLETTTDRLSEVFDVPDPADLETEIVWPIQSFTKSECPQRDGVTTDPRLVGRAW